MLADILSLTRIPLALLFPYFGLSGRLILLSLAALSDVLDGYMARTYAMGSRYGKLIDPLADKFFALFLVITFLREGLFPLSALPFFFAREWALLAFGLVQLLRRRLHTIELGAIISGKIFTLLQFGILLMLTLGWGYPSIMNIPLLLLGLVAFFELLIRRAAV